MKKFVVKNFDTQTYYCGKYNGFSDIMNRVKYFDTHEDAETLIKRLNGKFQIEVVYIV